MSDRTEEPTSVSPTDVSIDSEVVAPGTVVGGFVVGGKIARGGCGTVYRARHVDGRLVALKILHRELAENLEMVVRFIREVRAVDVIRHPNIVEIYDFGNLENGRPYYVMEFLEGITLKHLLQKRGRFSAPEMLALVEPVCQALGTAHDRGIIHRDIKLSNIMVAETKIGRVVKLLDFGIAKLTQPPPGEEGLTALGKRIGTPHWMAPEQIRGQGVDQRTDIYAVGLLIHMMLSGQYVFDAPTELELERLHLEAPPGHLSEICAVSPAIEAVVLRCLEKQSERRFPSTEALLDALRQAVGEPSHPAEALPNAPVAAVLVAIRLPVSPDDALMDAAGDVLDLAADALQRAGFFLPLQTATDVLGVCRLGEAPDEVLARALDTAVALGAEIKAKSASSLVPTTLCVHLSEGIPSGAAEVRGGPVLRTEGWAPPPEIVGVVVTRDVAVRLPAGTVGTLVGGFAAPSAPR